MSAAFTIDREFIRPHRRSGHEVKGYWRAIPARRQRTVRAEFAILTGE